MKDKEFIVYEGRGFTVEWYYDANGKSQPLDYYEGLDTGQRAKFLSLVRLIGDVGKIFNKQKFNNEGDKIFAFKPQPDRFLCFFFEGAKIIITHAFVKKPDKLPVNEKERALRHMRDFVERVKKGSYYDG